MGPLVPDLISNDLNFIVALVIGIFFGAILEQAGFSTSKKLVGLFYGYDFTVLRVFFTAGIVAMIGIMAFEHYGLIDMNLVYINPTFLTSAIVGGLIMGLGFVVGGFCPGTSFCAAAIGKIDAMIFIVGAFIGVFIFAEMYPLIEGIYKAAYWGSPRLFELLGMSQSIFGFVMAAFALAAFFVTSIIENKVNGIKQPAIRFEPYFIGLASIGVILAFSAFLFPERKDSLLNLTEEKHFVDSYQLEMMTADELAFRLMNKDENKLQIIDFRNEKDFKAFNLPKSTLFTIENLFEKEPNRILSLRNKINVFVANDEFQAKRIAIIANELGFKRIKVLEGGLEKFRKEILEFTPIANPKTIDEENQNRFRTKASRIIPQLIEANKYNGPVKKTQKRVIGGC